MRPSLLLPVLLSGGRPNLLVSAEDFSSASWTKDGTVTVTANAVVSPRGTLTADRLVSTAGAGSYCLQDYSTTDAGMYAGSLYLRAAAPQNAVLNLQQIGGVGAGAITSVTCAVTAEWQRFSVSHIFTDLTAVRVSITPSGGVDFDVYAWGAKLERGPNATRYRAV